MTAKSTRVPVVAVLAALGFANVCASSVFFPMLPVLQDSLRLSATQLGAWMSIPALISLVLGPVAGRIGDLSGRKSVMIMGLSGFAFGGVLSFYAPHLRWLSPYLWIMGGRVLMSLGHVVTFPQYLAIAGEAVPPGGRQAAMATVETWTSVGSIVGTLVGGVLMSFGVYTPFLALSAIVLVALAIVIAAVHPHGQKHRNATVALGRPDLPSLTRSWYGYLAGFLVMALMVSVETFAGSFLRDRMGASLLVLRITATMVPAAMVVGSLLVSVRKGEHRVGDRNVAVSVAVSLGGLLLLAVSTSVAAAWAGLLTLGVGLGVWLPILDEDISATSNDLTRGTRLSILHGSKTTGSLVAPAMLGELIDRTGNYGLSLSVLLGVSLVLSLACLAGRRAESGSR